MLDHIGFDVTNFAKSKKFYLQALKPLGIDIIMDVTAEQSGTTDYCGMGKEGKPFFWFGEGKHGGKSLHVAFTADSHEMVDAFYTAAITAGGTDNGAPGPRPHYHPNYYGAFVLDLDGNNIEAVFHG